MIYNHGRRNTEIGAGEEAVAGRGRLGADGQRQRNENSKCQTVHDVDVDG